MSYIGKIPATGNFVKLDAISVVNGQASYTMQSNSVNFTPESANHMLVSLNGVIQAPQTSFTISGSTITFASALSTGDVINFIMVYGNVLDIGTPSDDTISTAKLQNTSVTAGKLATDSVIEAKIQNDAVTRDKINAISTSSAPSFEAKGDGSSVEGKIQLNCHVNSHGVVLQSPPHSSGQSYTIKLPDNQIAVDKFIKVKSITGSGSTAVGQTEFADVSGGISVADQFRVTSNITANDVITSNIERVDTSGQAGFTANQMSESSGIFTFPLTGIYLVSAGGRGDTPSSADNVAMGIEVTTDNNTYNSFVSLGESGGASGSAKNFTVYGQTLVDVTDVSNVKVRFSIGSLASGSFFSGSTTTNQTYMTFIRLGDT